MLFKHAVASVVSLKQNNFWKSVFSLLIFCSVFGFVSYSAVAELTQVSVGGEIRIRGRWYMNTWEDERPLPNRIKANYLPWRPIGPSGTISQFKWDSSGRNWTRLESSVKLNVKADFTNNVSAFIELYDWYVFGESFRSNYLLGSDKRADGLDQVQLHQAYIELREIFDTPVSLRVGRQELLFGSGWLLSNMLTPSQYLFHDAVRLTYNDANFTVDAFMAKQNDSLRFFDEQINLYGLYGTYKGFEPLTMSAYWLYVHDNTDIESRELTSWGNWVNSRLGRHFGSTNLHTVGTHLFGKHAGFDYNVEVAYQFGDADHIGAMFDNGGFFNGDTGAKYDNWGMEAILGYTFTDVSWKPRLFIQGVYFQGEDNRSISFWDWMNPFYKPQASVSFNRLFSEKNYAPTINDNSLLSNFIQATAGVEVQPTEKVRLHLHVAKNWADEAFDPPKSIKVAGRRVYVAPGLSFWTDKGSDDLGWEIAAWARYEYSQDLSFLLYGNVLFPGDGLTRGSFLHFFGTQFSGGTSDDTAGYLFWMATLKF
ncbi:MAG: alginate export family protein [Candidatus Hydrogenedentes bacterium]|nr:alginate export family protein [Candidatus Hydrogenedentota bacterium]